MKERGQVFTLDMLFALVLVGAFISVSGQAYELTTGQTRSYSTRYSLERTANDAADTLVKSLGTPDNWEDNLESLETPGLAKADANNNPVQNEIDIRKLANLRDLCRWANWPVEPVSWLFGGTDNFEVRVIYRDLLAREPLADLDFDIENTLFGVEADIEAENEDGQIEAEVDLDWDGESESAPSFTMMVTGGGLTIKVIVGGGVIEVWYKTTLWDFWPEWDVEDSSGVENSLEVAVVKRLAFLRYGPALLREDTGKLVKLEKNLGTEHYEENFRLYEGELEMYDWYLVIRTAEQSENQVDEVRVKVNDQGQQYRYDPQSDGSEAVLPNDWMPTSRGHDVSHGGMENDSMLNAPPVVGLDNLDIWVKPWNDPATPGNDAEGDWARLSVVGIPACSPPEIAEIAPNKTPVTVEVLVWR
ncbi:hypothetical protein AKJ48_03300 [candidate division MSBL1 archaeon SCGC-AAA261O19]|uniref:Uncharacterized protein n=2 Tax=candidate division MSBL1 TaxID=215777 RepID=A0A133V108_9EURY|nr:hypothetical protein AKJ42_01650 [candidate division MSBL1 archaeon SCGC-AAA261C02]KXB04180.1 hypothetical protein AKJ48_03300 [candidate division MSBL1 archaeon SCGC-AAA261O19]